MILESVENGPLIWPTVEENGVIRTKKYVELSAAKKIQADCDIKATNIILQGLPADIYSLVNHHRVAKDLWERVQLLMQGDDLISCLNKALAFLTTVATSRFPSTNNQLRTSSNPRNHGRQGQSYSGTGYKSSATSSEGNNASGHARITEDLDTYDSNYDDVSNAKAVIMANISNYGSDVISEVPHSKTYLNVMENQSMHAMQDFEQTPAMDFIDNEIHSDSNIIPYSQYLQETQLENVQDTNFQKLTLKEQVDSLEQNISKQIKEKECLLQTFNVFKSESKEKEDKYMENEIDLEKKIKELDNILFKEGQCAQIVHMLT
ncbi:hypothetical protein Tco_0824755 [Tanacetum coccineum]|uniref:Integrase, catalytic region, zinc finger, CCHC-type, peptidase aspartic, catalytic n=1 Tax=Tanacetum coccineum TaxID=301880 RepID=A0ABQ5AQJ1_9ASTR